MNLRKKCCIKIKIPFVEKEMVFDLRGKSFFNDPEGGSILSYFFMGGTAGIGTNEISQKTL